MQPALQSGCVTVGDVKGKAAPNRLVGHPRAKRLLHFKRNATNRMCSRPHMQGSVTGAVPAARRLVPIKQEQWTPEVCQALWLDTEVRVRVHRVRRRGPAVATHPSGCPSVYWSMLLPC